MNKLAEHYKLNENVELIILSNNSCLITDSINGKILIEINDHYKQEWVKDFFKKLKHFCTFEELYRLTPYNESKTRALVNSFANKGLLIIQYFSEEKPYSKINLLIICSSRELEKKILKKAQDKQIFHNENIYVSNLKEKPLIDVEKKLEKMINEKERKNIWLVYANQYVNFDKHYQINKMSQQKRVNLILARFNLNECTISNAIIPNTTGCLECSITQKEAEKYSVTKPMKIVKGQNIQSSENILGNSENDLVAQQLVESLITKIEILNYGGLIDSIRMEHTFSIPDISHKSIKRKILKINTCTSCI